MRYCSGVSDQATAALGPYSRGGEDHASFVVFSGKLGIDTATGKLTGDDFVAQLRHTLPNLEHILSSRRSRPICRSRVDCGH
jgi:enamine deaminase RidA (YjgF/YER057c/UK114 family)